MAFLSGTESQDESDPAYSSSSKDVTEFKTSLLSIPDFQDAYILLTDFASSPVSHLFYGRMDFQMYLTNCYLFCLLRLFSEGFSCWAEFTNVTAFGR